MYGTDPFDKRIIATCGGATFDLLGGVVVEASRPERMEINHIDHVLSHLLLPVTAGSLSRNR